MGVLFRVVWRSSCLYAHKPGLLLLLIMRPTQSVLSNPLFVFYMALVHFLGLVTFPVSTVFIAVFVFTLACLSIKKKKKKKKIKKKKKNKKKKKKKKKKVVCLDTTA